MNIEHKLEPVEHWIVNGKAYRLATEADVGKGVLLTDYELSTRGNVPDVAHELKSMSYMAGGNVWKYAYIQDDSLLSPPTPQRTPVSVPEPKPIDNGESPGYAGKDYDGLENVPQRIQKTHWMNIDSDGDFWAHESKEAADADRGEGTVACIPFVVDCEEGEGL